jgi:hypothetical protein
MASGDGCPLSVRVSDAGLVRAVDTVRGRRRKASDERTRGKAVRTWRSMGIWRGSDFAGGWTSQDRRERKAAEDGGLDAVAVLDGVIEDWSLKLW